MELPKSSNLKPVSPNQNTMVNPVYDKDGALISNKDASMAIITNILEGHYFSRRTKKMATDIEQAEEIVKKAIALYQGGLQEFYNLETKFELVVKKQSGVLRDSIQKLGDSITKLEKVGDINALERKVLLLERAATAMEQLSALQATGKLDKILTAIK